MINVQRKYRWDIALIYALSALIIVLFILNQNKNWLNILSAMLICCGLLSESCFLFEPKSDKIDNGIFKAIPMCTYVILSIYFVQNKILSINCPDNIILFSMGMVFFSTAITLRILAFLSLKSAFSYSVTCFSDQKLIKIGVYKIIRHPAYLGALFYLIGIELFYPTWIGIVVIIIFFPVTVMRMNKEEQLLDHNFGQEYINYKKKTKRIIPYFY